MADENEIVDEAGQQETAEDAQEPQEGTESGEETEGQGEGTPEDEEVPAEVLRNELTQARKDAANYRTQLREAQDKLSKAKTVEEFEEARAEFDQKFAALEAENLKFRVATDPEINLPVAAIKFLTGTTEEELKASAAELKELFGQSTSKPKGGIKPPPSGGLDPSDEPKRYTPADIRKEMYRPTRY